MQEKTIHIKGMNCRACTLLVANELKNLPGVTKADVSLADNSATIEAFEIPAQEEIQLAIKNAGYSIG